MNRVKWFLTPGKITGRIKPEIYGGFVEHLGRNVYGGCYEPGSPAADEDGFRKDVLELIRELNMPVTRYPGGCYVDLERWEDSVGPDRRSRIDPAWKQLEPNTFGLDEFMKWAAKAETVPLITVNASNRTLLDTLSLYEYCNFPGGTYWSDKRRTNGVEKPYNVKNWCIGNELYGKWEFGEQSAEEYGRVAREHGKLLKTLDPDCRVIVCGTPDDEAWNKKVLEISGMYADVLSLHDVFCRAEGADEQQYLRTVDNFEKKLTAAVKTCKAAGEAAGRRISVSVDEWIIWDFDRRMHPEEEWTAGMHLLEQDYTILEALITGSLFSCFHRHADDIDMACIAQSVNVIAPIRTEKDGRSWRQSIFYPFALSSRFGRGVSLDISEEGNEQQDLYGSAVYDKDQKNLTLFITNRSAQEYGFETAFPQVETLGKCVCMHSDDLTAVNSVNSNLLQPQELSAVWDGDKLKSVLPGFSWNMLQLKLQ